MPGSPWASMGVRQSAYAGKGHAHIRLWGGVVCASSVTSSFQVDPRGDLQRPVSLPANVSPRLQAPNTHFRPIHAAKPCHNTHRLASSCRQLLDSTRYTRRTPIAPWTLSKSPLGATLPNPRSHPRTLRRPRHPLPSPPSPRLPHPDRHAQDLAASWPSPLGSKPLTTTLSDLSAPSAALRAAPPPTDKMRPQFLPRRRRW